MFLGIVLRGSQQEPLVEQQLFNSLLEVFTDDWLTSAIKNYTITVSYLIVEYSETFNHGLTDLHIVQIQVCLIYQIRRYPEILNVG